MSNMLNQRYTFTKLRAKLKEREEKIYWNCRKFGYLVHNCRNKKEGKKKKQIFHNKYEVSTNRVIVEPGQW